MHDGDSQYFTALACFTAYHDLLETGPVVLSQALGNDQVERFANRLGLSESEDTLGGGVP